jgi:hypothetical protein
MAAPFSFAGGAATRTGVFVVGGATHSVSVARLDRRSRVWHPAAQPTVPRVHCAVAALPEMLFLLVSAPPMGLKENASAVDQQERSDAG